MVISRPNLHAELKTTVSRPAPPRTSTSIGLTETAPSPSSDAGNPSTPCRRQCEPMMPVAMIRATKARVTVQPCQVCGRSPTPTRFGPNHGRDVFLFILRSFVIVAAPGVLLRSPASAASTAPPLPLVPLKPSSRSASTKSTTQWPALHTSTPARSARRPTEAMSARRLRRRNGGRGSGCERIVEQSSHHESLQREALLHDQPEPGPPPPGGGS